MRYEPATRRLLPIPTLCSSNFVTEITESSILNASIRILPSTARVPANGSHRRIEVSHSTPRLSNETSMLRSVSHDFARHPLLIIESVAYVFTRDLQAPPRDSYCTTWYTVQYCMIRRSFASNFSIFATTSRQNWADYRQCRHIWTLPPYCEPGEQATQYHHGPGRQGFMPTLYS